MITPSNVHLPPQTTSFIGRTDEIVQIAQRLSEPDCHLLTLVGPGGIGKTRLAIEVAKHLVGAGLRPAQFTAPADGIHFVDLQPVSSADLLVTALADAIGMIFFGEQPPRLQLLNHLRDHDTLLLIDNFEHLLDAVDLLIDMVKIAPNVKLLVTSREALSVQEEWLWQVEGLQVPGGVSVPSMDDYSAVRMFVERARHVRADFVFAGQESDVTRICQLVDGMPLALELAASWTRVLSCEEIISQIQQELDFLKTHLRNIPERHRSMRAVFDRSWMLMTEAEQAVFPKLSVFRGGSRHEAAEAVAGASITTLAGLVDKSLLKVNSSGRYYLHELVRQYAEKWLETLPGGKEVAQDQHCAYFAHFLHRSEAELRGPGQIAALDKIAEELDNVRVAWRWAVERGKEQELSQGAPALFLYCQMRSKANEGERLFAPAASRFDQEKNALLGYFLLSWEWFGGWNGQGRPIEPILKAIKLLCLSDIRESSALPLTIRVVNDAGNFDYEESRVFYLELLNHFEMRGELWGAAWMHFCLGQVFNRFQKFDEAEKYYLQSLDIFGKVGDRWATCFPLGALGLLCGKSGKYPQAKQYLQEQRRICREVGDTSGIIFTTHAEALISIKSSDWENVNRCLVLGLEVLLESGSHLSMIYVFLSLCADVLIKRGDKEQAVEILGFVGQDASRTEALAATRAIKNILETLADQVMPEVFHSALQRGKQLDLKTAALWLLEIFSTLPQPDQPLSDPLSQRELEVLRLLSTGLKNAEIAQKLVVAPGTIKAHTSAIYRKLDVTSRIQAVARAQELKLL